MEKMEDLITKVIKEIKDFLLDNQKRIKKLEKTVEGLSYRLDQVAGNTGNL